jgi:hypothetical protein
MTIDKALRRVFAGCMVVAVAVIGWSALTAPTPKAPPSSATPEQAITARDDPPMADPAMAETSPLQAAEEKMKFQDEMLGQAYAAVICGLRGPAWFQAFQVAHQRTIDAAPGPIRLRGSDQVAFERFLDTDMRRSATETAGARLEKCVGLAHDDLLARLDQAEIEIVGTYH